MASRSRSSARRRPHGAGNSGAACSFGSPGERVYRTLDRSFFEAGIMIHPAGDTIQLMQLLIISEDQIVMDKVRASTKAAA
jgi:adenosylmethionine-8-amino-7-oxononanoate aminotransferase